MKLPGCGRTACLCALVSGVSLFATGCGESSANSDETSKPRVEVVVLEFETLHSERRWTSVTAPMRSVAVPSPEDGVVAELFVTDGGFVEKGDRLSRIDGPDLTARYGVLVQRRMALAAELSRWERLAEAQAAGPGEVEAARLRLLGVEETLATLEARKALAEVSAPVSGRVVGLSSASGATVSRGEILMRIEDGQSIGTRLLVPALEAKYFEITDRLSVRDPGGGSFGISRVVTTEDQTARGYVTVEIRLKETNVFDPVEAEVTYREAREAILVPWTSVAREGETHWVAVVSGDPAVIGRREVVLGAARAEGVEVSSGLAAKERILRFEPRSQPTGREVTVVTRNR